MPVVASLSSLFLPNQAPDCVFLPLQDVGAAQISFSSKKIAPKMSLVCCLKLFMIMNNTIRVRLSKLLDCHGSVPNQWSCYVSGTKR